MYINTEKQKLATSICRLAGYTITLMLCIIGMVLCAYIGLKGLYLLLPEVMTQTAGDMHTRHTGETGSIIRLFFGAPYLIIITVVAIAIKVIDHMSNAPIGLSQSVGFTFLPWLLGSLSGIAFITDSSPWLLGYLPEIAFITDSSPTIQQYNLTGMITAPFVLTSLSLSAMYVAYKKVKARGYVVIEVIDD